MQLDKFTDYALRVLITLSVRAPDRMSAAQIAQVNGLSTHHLAKIATELVRSGFVTSGRGRGGGLTLARQADDINIGAVLRALRGNAPVAECFGKTCFCVILPACGLPNPLVEAQEAFFAALDRYTLADVTKNSTQLAALLAPNAAASPDP
jgi:Rrf2 family nitric oxide-sensitive transcriptional repressor